MTRFTASVQFVFEREVEVFADSPEEAHAKASEARCGELDDARVDVVFDVREEE